MENQPRPANRILTALPHEEFEQLRPKLRDITFQLGENVYLPEQEMKYVYFVNQGIISWLASLETGNTVEAGVIGPEGVAGVPIILGATSTPNEGLAQSDVRASRIAAADMVIEFRRNPKLNQLMLRFVHSMFIQVAQTAACNRLHTLDQRLARWLLMTQDRVNGHRITLTQEFLSRMLGVRRAGVSVAANSLRQQALIDYHRGDIIVTDRTGLEGLSCECYRIVKHEYDDYMPS
jgi:CRP-like cAMP-binding protein